MKSRSLENQKAITNMVYVETASAGSLDIVRHERPQLYAAVLSWCRAEIAD